MRKAFSVAVPAVEHSADASAGAARQCVSSWSHAIAFTSGLLAPTHLLQPCEDPVTGTSIHHDPVRLTPAAHQRLIVRSLLGRIPGQDHEGIGHAGIRVRHLEASANQEPDPRLSPSLYGVDSRPRQLLSL
jgi:hypothetical protein